MSATASAPIARGFAGYRRLLSAPRVLPLVITSVLARFQTGMAAVALILFVHGTSGSFGPAGIVAGAFTVGLGLTGPLLGRLIDRHGPRPVMIPGAIIGALALASVVPLGDGGAGTLPLAAAAFVGGGATPPVSGVLRRQWPDLVSPADLPTAFALDAIVVEVYFIAGPLLAGVLAATAGSASGVIVAAALGGIGTLLFARLSVVEPARTDAPTHWLGAIASPRLRLLVFAGIPMGGMFGALDVALPAFGAHHGAAALGGPYTAALAFGSVLGGIAYGARPDALGPPRRAILAFGALTVALCLPLLTAASIAEMFPFAALAGLCIAPMTSIRNQLLQIAPPPGSEIEAFTWLALSSTVGVSLGSAVAGPLAQAAGWRAAAALACALPAVMTAVLLLDRGVLRDPPWPYER